MASLSPKQYFQQKLRSLPMHICYANENWQEAGMANVLVTRKHVTGNLSGAFFLVDLKCLGVKEVLWFFNQSEEEMEEMMENMGDMFMEIEYNLAHNIIYAGHDFAAEYHISPDPEFAIARLALEEDDNKVELLDIATGEDGIPHLMERHPGQYSDALAKLKKYAGEGHYKHSIVFGSSEEADEQEDAWGDDLDSEDDDYNEEFDDIEDIRLADIPVGELSLQQVMEMPDEDLSDLDQIEKRNQFEQWMLLVENVARNFPADDDNEEEEASFYNTSLDLLDNALDYPNNIPLREMETGLKATLAVLDIHKDDLNNEATIFTAVRSQLDLHGDNPIFLSKMCLLFSEISPSVKNLLEGHIANLAQIPLVRLSNVFSLYWKNNIDSGILPEAIAESTHPHEAFPEFDAFSDYELALFWAIKSLQCAGNKDLERMIWYYSMFADTNYSSDNQEITTAFILGLAPRIVPQIEEIARQHNN